MKLKISNQYSELNAYLRFALGAETSVSHVEVLGQHSRRAKVKAWVSGEKF